MILNDLKYAQVVMMTTSTFCLFVHGNSANIIFSVDSWTSWVLEPVVRIIVSTAWWPLKCNGSKNSAWFASKARLNVT